MQTRRCGIDERVRSAGVVHSNPVQKDTNIGEGGNRKPPHKRRFPCCLLISKSGMLGGFSGKILFTFSLFNRLLTVEWHDRSRQFHIEMTLIV